MRPLNAFINKDVIKRMRRNSEIVEIKNPTISDIRNGVVVHIDNEGEILTYIAISPKQMSGFIYDLLEDKDKRSGDIMFVRYSYVSKSGAGYWPFTSFIDRFPRHNIFPVEIINVYNTGIDTSKIDSRKSLEKVWKDVCKQIENI